MLNPMNSNYHGYSRAPQSVIEEDEGAEDIREDVDLEAGRSTIFQSAHEAKPSARAQGKRRAGWDPGASEMNTLHPNIHKEDRMHNHESSDDEVPPNHFMVEPAQRKPATSPKFKAQSISPKPRRSHALHSVDARKLPPPLPSPAHVPASLPAEELPFRQPRPSTPGARSTTSARPRTAMRGLDDYEKALWNWVNVYNLDAFLQEVYAYYEGKGIYSIALSRGLNLL